MGESLYERDFYAWANEQAALLRAGRMDAADLANIAEEIESMGRSEKRELVNRLAVLLLLLLKWQHQPHRRGRSWRASVKEQRLRFSTHLRDNPSLKAKLDEAVTEGYELALVMAERETRLPRRTFPVICPYTIDQIRDDGFWPE